MSTFPIPTQFSLIDLLLAADQIGPMAGLLPQIVQPVVVDADVIIDELPRVASGGDSSLLRAAYRGGIRLYGKSDLIDEVRRHLPIGMHDEDQLAATLERAYLPRIRLVDVSEVELLDPRLEAIASEAAKDYDTARLSLLLAPSIVITRDADLKRHGFGNWLGESSDEVTWTHAAVALKDSSGYAAFYVSVGYAGSLAATVIQGLADLRQAARAKPGLSLLLLLTITGIAVAAYRSPALRARVLELHEALGPDLKALARMALDTLAWAESARPLLAQNAVVRDHAPDPVSRVARTLAILPPGRTVSQIREMLPDVAAASVLPTNPAFVQVGRGRWALGRQVTDD